MFALVIVAMTGAAILQIVAPRVHGKQRRLWHFDRMAARDWFLESRGAHQFWSPLVSTYDLGLSTVQILLALILGGIGIGTNHFIHF